MSLRAHLHETYELLRCTGWKIGKSECVVCVPLERTLSPHVVSTDYWSDSILTCGCLRDVFRSRDGVYTRGCPVHQPLRGIGQPFSQRPLLSPAPVLRVLLNHVPSGPSPLRQNTVWNDARRVSATNCRGAPKHTADLMLQSIVEIEQSCTSKLNEQVNPRPTFLFTSAIILYFYSITASTKPKPTTTLDSSFFLVRRKRGIIHN